MALVGEGRGFKIMVVFSILVVLLTLPLMLIELRSPGLSLARGNDLGYVPVECRINHRARTIEVVTRLSAALPEGYPLKVSVLVTGAGQQILAEFATKEFVRDVRRPDLLVIRGPITDSDAKAWRSATVSCTVHRQDISLFTFSGHYLPPNLALIDVTVTRSGDEPAP